MVAVLEIEFREQQLRLLQAPPVLQLCLLLVALATSVCSEEPGPCP